MTTLRRDGGTAVGLLVYRMIGAALLDPGVYEGIEADRAAMRQAVACVLISSVAAGIGAADWAGPTATAILAVAAVALVTWIAWAMLVFQIGAHLLPGPETQASPAELVRTIGFAAAPGALQVLAILPRMRGPIFAVAWIWIGVATVVAVKHALDYRSTARALVVCGLAASLCLVLAAAVSLVLSPSVR